MHSKVGAYEWSGELITREEGTINDLEDWKITAEDIFLADIGTSGGTEYEVNRGAFKSSDIIELYEKYPELEDGVLKLQHIHTHHSMSTFFSGTDWENLEDRALVSNYFLMMIVNFAGDIKAKVAFKAIVEGNKGTKLIFANNEDGYKPLVLGGKEEKEVLVVMDCKIEMEDNKLEVPKDFEDRYEAVKKAIEDEKAKEVEERKNKYKGGYSHGMGQGQLPFKKDAGEPWTPNEHWDADLPENTYTPNGNWREEYEYVKGVWQPKQKKEKKISEMTDKEYQKWEEEEAAEKVFLKDQEQQDIVKFTEKHARGFLNSIINGTYLIDDTRDLKVILIAENKGIESKDDLAAWLDGFQLMLQEHFDVIFYPNTVIQYGELLDACKSYLEQYKTNRLVAGMIETIEEEIEMSYTPVK